MMFFFKEKPIEITAYVRPEHSYVLEYSPIKPAKNFYPQWWKDLDSSSFNWEILKTSTTVKSCPGVNQTLQTGFILPMWSDCALEFNKDYWKYQFSDQQSEMGLHDNKQMQGYYEDHFIFKMKSPWFIKSPVKLLYTDPFYLHKEPRLPFTIPYGISPALSRENLHSTNTFLLAKKEEEMTRVMFKCNTPLLHIIPLTDKPIKFNCEILNSETSNIFRNILGTSNSFTSRGLKNIHFTNKNK